MMKIQLQGTLLVLAAALLLTATGCQNPAGKNQVCLKSYCFDVEVASDDAARFRGLQGRAQLGGKEGMLFIFPESRPYPFWMKDTLIPLDLIWLDYRHEVVHVETNVPPCQKDPCPNYVPPEAALYVLEVQAGMCERLGLKKGDRLSFRLEKYLKETFK